MPGAPIPLAKEIGRVPSMTVPLDADQEQRYQRLVNETILIDVHQHPFVCPEDMTRLVELLRGNEYKWGYEAVRHGGWTAVTTANAFRGFVNTTDMSFTRFEDLQTEVALMLSDLSLTDRAVPADWSSRRPIRLLLRLHLPGPELEYFPASSSQGGVASGGAISQGWFHRDQPELSTQRNSPLLQWPWHGGAVDQGGQVRPELDQTVLSQVRGQPGEAMAVRSGVQSGKLHEKVGFAGGYEALDSDQSSD